MKRTHFDLIEFDTLCNKLGNLYEEFRSHLEHKDCPVAPNDHIIGVIGEWRAIQILDSTGVSSRKDSSDPNALNDLLITCGNDINETISVKAITLHSKTGRSGSVTFKGSWTWMLVVMLSRNLELSGYFWLSRKSVETIFPQKQIKLEGGKTKNENSQFSLKKALKQHRFKREKPGWFHGSVCGSCGESENVNKDFFLIGANELTDPMKTTLNAEKPKYADTRPHLPEDCKKRLNESPFGWMFQPKLCWAMYFSRGRAVQCTRCPSTGMSGLRSVLREAA